MCVCVQFTLTAQLPEVSFQLFLFNQRGHDGSDQELVGDSADQEVSKDTDESNPSSAGNTHALHRNPTATCQFMLINQITSKKSHETLTC